MSNRPPIVVLAALLAGLGLVSSSFASERHLAGAAAPFADCPLGDPAVTGCIVAEERGGEFLIGRRTVPIDSPFTLQGGLYRSSPGPPEELTFVGAEDGSTLSKAALSLPGGLAGILAPAYLPASLLGPFDAAIASGVSGVTMTPELALPASAIELSEYNLLLQEEVAVRLPLKIKLSNPFLGSNCYIGSSTNPIILNLTTGSTSPPTPARPIQGTSGLLELMEQATIAELRGNVLVDNAFPVPKATGCGGSYSAVVDAAVDTEIGLPSPAGRNTAILDGNVEKDSVTALRESE